MRMRIRAKFENGVFWEQYTDLERQFQNFLEYIPYFDRNKNTISFRLASLILSVGGHVDSMFKEMARYSKYRSSADCKEILTRAKNRRPIIVQCLRFFDREYNLSEKEVTFKCLPQRAKVMPFVPADLPRVVPKWWDVYNGLKHEFSANFHTANLENSRDALAGAFLLNVRHIAGAVRLSEYGIMKTEIRTPTGRVKNTFAPPDPVQVRKILEEGKGIAGTYVETPLFLYEYRQ